MVKTITLIFNIILTLAILFNINWLHNPFLGVVLGLLYLIIFGFYWGKLIFPSDNKPWQLLIGSLTYISIYSFIGAITYYVYRLDLMTINILTVLISALTIFLNYIKSKPHDFKLPGLKFKISNLDLQTIILSVYYLILFLVAIIILFNNQTAEAIRSVWQIIPKAFFLIYFLASLNLIFIIYKKFRPYMLIFVCLHFFLTTSLALIVYRLEFGFDPFIHRVTELAIFNQGAIYPKPFYYLGQYSLVIFLSHLLQISVEWTDKLLLPILLSVFLPLTVYFSVTKTFTWAKNQSAISALIFLLIPFGLFIATTPQALANLFGIVTLFLSFLYLKEKKIPYFLLIGFTLTTLFIHAISGIPIIIYICLVWLINHKNKLTKYLIPVFSLGAVIVLPLALIANSLISIYKVKFDWQIINFISWPTIFSRQYNFFLDLAYLYNNFIHLIIIISAISIFYHLSKQKLSAVFLPSLLTFLILVINSILLNFIKVSFIINYEQGEFSLRVYQLAFYFLLPLIIYGFYLILNELQTQQFINQSALIFILALCLTLSLYLSYPRFDDYDNTKLINVSQADFETVQFIENNSQNKPYIVLSNQMTSVAALKIFGFSRYYSGQYFYPIPTGGELYKYFEKMIYDTPDKEVMLSAMDLTGVDIAYFILPSYWSGYDLIVEQASKYADAIYSLDDKMIIFKYFR